MNSKRKIKGIDLGHQVPTERAKVHVSIDREIKYYADITVRTRSRSIAYLAIVIGSVGTDVALLLLNVPPYLVAGFTAIAFGSIGAAVGSWLSIGALGRRKRRLESLQDSIDARGDK